jgi:hypothetical protein
MLLKGALLQQAKLRIADVSTAECVDVDFSGG